MQKNYKNKESFPGIAFIIKQVKQDIQHKFFAKRVSP